MKLRSFLAVMSFLYAWTALLVMPLRQFLLEFIKQFWWGPGQLELLTWLVWMSWTCGLMILLNLAFGGDPAEEQSR